jgi:hypothetical protein
MRVVKIDLDKFSGIALGTRHANDAKRGLINELREFPVMGCDQDAPQYISLGARRFVHLGINPFFPEP